MFIYNPTHSYDDFFHSSKNRRGVGILISNKLSYSVEKYYKDTEENILGLSLKINDFPLRVFSNDNIDIRNMRIPPGLGKSAPGGAYLTRSGLYTPTWETTPSYPVEGGLTGHV